MNFARLFEHLQEQEERTPLFSLPVPREHMTRVVDLFADLQAYVKEGPDSEFDRTGREDRHQKLWDFLYSILPECRGHKCEIDTGMATSWKVDAMEAWSPPTESDEFDFVVEVPRNSDDFVDMLQICQGRFRCMEEHSYHVWTQIEGFLSRWSVATGTAMPDPLSTGWKLDIVRLGLPVRIFIMHKPQTDESDD